MLSSRHNRLVKRAKALLRRRTRAAEGAFLVEGARAVETVFEAGAELQAVLLDPEAGLVDLAVKLSSGGCEPTLVAADLLAEVSDVVAPPGIVAIVTAPAHQLPDLCGAPRLLVLDQVRDPGNVGTLLRTAHATGSAVLFIQGCCDPLSPKVVRASAGAIVHTVWTHATADEALAWLPDSGYQTVVLAGGAQSLYHGALPSHPAFVVGNEAHGAAESWPGERRGLPMQPGAESLNAGIAAAVALYESVRQSG